MAGPACSILLRHSADEALLAARAELVRLVACSTEGDDFWVADTSSIGGNYNGEARPFLFEIEDLLDHHDLSALRVVEQIFGWLPAREALTTIAMCGSLEDHQILGEITQWLALRVDGLVMFDWVLELPPEVAGRGAQVTYQIGDGRRGSMAVVDPVAFGDLLRSPTFFLVK